MAHFQSEKYPSVYRKHVHVHDSNYFSSFVFVDATQTRVCVCVYVCTNWSIYQINIWLFVQGFLHLN